MNDKYSLPLKMLPRTGAQFHAMAKPSGSACNLDCTYCFYLSKETLPKGPGVGQMSDETLELFVKHYIDGVTGPEVVFTWQGGEPTLCGLDFFARVVELQKKHAKPGQRVENDLQTNGILLDDKWVTFLKSHGFLVGLSIDGPREMHDRLRVNKGGGPTFDRVMSAARRLQAAGVPFNTLTCVHRFNASRPIDVYRFLRDDLGARYIQFIPVVQAKDFETQAPWTAAHSAMPIVGSPRARPGHPESVVTDWSVDPDEYGEFLSRIFDEWLRKDVGKVAVNHFETLLAQHMGQPAQICIYNRFCGKGVAVEHDGSVYSCDHYVYPEYRLGHLQDERLVEMVLSPTQVRFGYAKSEALTKYCQGCSFLKDCWGECPKNRLISAPDGEPGLNYLCAGLKKFFGHAIPEIDRIAAHLRTDRVV